MKRPKYKLTGEEAKIKKLSLNFEDLLRKFPVSPKENMLPPTDHQNWELFKTHSINHQK